MLDTLCLVNLYNAPCSLARSMYFDTESLALLEEVLPRLAAGFTALPDGPSPPLDYAAMLAVLEQVADRMQQNYPYFHPLYAGQDAETAASYRPRGLRAGHLD